MSAPPGNVVALAFDPGSGAWLAFPSPERVVVAERPDEVAGVLAEVEAATAAGRWAVGFVAYEAAPGLDAALPTHAPGPWPLAWFALGEAPKSLPTLPPGDTPPTLPAWVPEWDAVRHGEALAAVKAAIARGDTYQVNLTFRLRAGGVGDPWALFRTLWERQSVPWACWIDAGRWVVLSLSPELFFRREGDLVTTRPMKGTAPRGRWPAEDRERAAALAASAKERAENLMIVDMLRNDLGRVASPGSVRVEELFATERLATLWQMTSTVTARSAAPLPDLFRALFPCASVTGAPKASTMALVRELETSPRGLYTGAVGWAGPGGRCAFNVAIRTVVVDRRTERAEYGVGSGIVWDSQPEAEHAECLAKALALGAPAADFDLLETLAWRPGDGYALLERHLARLAASADRLGFPPPDGAAAALAEAVRGRDEPLRVRLLLDRQGRCRAEAAPLGPVGGVWRVGIAPEPVDASSLLLFHKTTQRAVYERALAAVSGCDEALLVNREGELTEGTRTNLVLRLDGDLVTPPLACGLLPGTFRAELLAEGRVRERVLRPEDLARADEIWLVSSVRGWVRGAMGPQ